MRCLKMKIISSRRCLAEWLGFSDSFEAVLRRYIGRWFVVFFLFSLLFLFFHANGDDRPIPTDAEHQQKKCLRTLESWECFLFVSGGWV